VVLIIFTIFAENDFMMLVELDRIGLEILVKGCNPYYIDTSNYLVKKAGRDWNDMCGVTKWRTLENLTDNELYELYLFCRNTKSNL